MQRCEPRGVGLGARCHEYHGSDLNNYATLQGNYSDLLVQLSHVYSQLRGDTSGVKNEDSAQVSFPILSTMHVILLEQTDHFSKLHVSLTPKQTFIPTETKGLCFVSEYLQVLTHLPHDQVILICPTFCRYEESALGCFVLIAILTRI